MRIKIVTYNIHHGRGIDGRLNLKRIANVIRDSGAHIVGLNEVDRQFSFRSNYVDQIQWLAMELEMEWAFGESIVKGNRKYGNGLLSKYPILSLENHIITYPSWSQENRSILECSIQVEEEEFFVYVTHFSLKKSLQAIHLQKLLGLVKRNGGKTILLGDFNMHDSDEHYQVIENELLDTASFLHRKQPTFPSLFPRKRLDYVWVNKTGWHIQSVNVLKNNKLASDHLPLLVELKSDEIFE